MAATNETVEWNSTVTVERALRILGLSALPADMTAGFCRGRAAGMWDANEREYHVAYRSLAVALEAR